MAISIENKLLGKLRTKKGFTVKIYYKNVIKDVKKGFAVCFESNNVDLPSKRGLNSILVRNFIRTQIRSYFRVTEHKITSLCLGGWINDSVLYIDNTYVYKTEKEALKVAKTYNQKAIYDLEANKEIFVDYSE